MVVRRRWSWLIAVAVAAASAALFVAISWQQWLTGWVPSWDLGIFSQLAKAYAAGGAPIVPIKGTDYNLLGDHFHPILVLLGPAWKLWPTPMSLLALQGVLFGISAVPITRFAVRRFGVAFGVVLGLAYAMSWGLQSAVVSQFHEIAFAVPMLAFGLVAYLEGRLWPSVAWIAGLVFVKEDMGVTVAVFAAVLWFSSPHRWGVTRVVLRRIAAGLAAWGIGWVVLSTMVILPALNPHNQYDYTDRLLGLGMAFGSLDTYVGLVMLVAAFGLVGVRSPLALLVVPTLGWRLLGNVSFYWGWEWHYSATLMPVAFAALLDRVQGTRFSRYVASAAPSEVAAPDEVAASDERNDADTVAAEDTYAESADAVAAEVAVAESADAPVVVRPASGAVRATWLGWWALLIAVASTLALGPNQPALRLADEASWSEWRVPAMTATLDHVPAGTSVLTDLALMAYLVPEHEVYWVGSSHPVPDYVVQNRWSNAWSPEARWNLADWAERQFGVPYEVTHTDDGFVVAKRTR